MTPDGAERSTSSSRATLVTAFRPGPQLVTLVERLVPDGPTVVVDDSGGPPSPVLPLLSARGAEVRRHDENRGLAAALNSGIRHLARRHDVDRVTLWDQDSLPPARYTDQVLAALGQDAGRVVAAGLATGSPGHRRGGVPRAVPRLITSGMVLPWAALDEVGPFREDFFVDGVDTDYSFRLRSAGYRLVTVPSVGFAHTFGQQDRARRLRGMTSATSGHPPWRVYWVVRNEERLIREHRRSDPEGTDAVKRGRRTWVGKALAAGPARVATARAASAGLRDGRAGTVTARYDPRTWGRIDG